jgi:hypothetical protein
MLGHASPTVPIECTIPCSSNVSPRCTDVYWAPDRAARMRLICLRTLGEFHVALDLLVAARRVSTRASRSPCTPGTASDTAVAQPWFPEVT